MRETLPGPDFPLTGMVRFSPRVLGPPESGTRHLDLGIFLGKSGVDLVGGLLVKVIASQEF
jgi:hypothetical protein